LIIRSLQLHPFAGMADRTFEFDKGVNVLLGQNEAGKSTMINALRTVLLESTDYRKKKFDEELARFLPAGGGDTLRVTLELEQSGESYRLSKQWGSNKKSELRLPTGQIIASTKEVDERLAVMLSLKPGTWDNVLFAHQNHLSETLNTLEGETNEKTDLAGLLRSAVMATDSVSLEALEQIIASRLVELRLRWDEQMQRPESNRGVQNPWKVGLGKILQAWYAKESARNRLSQFDDYERALDLVVTQLSERMRERDDLQRYVDQWSPIAKAIGERGEIEARLALAVDQENRLKRVAIDWPQHEERLDYKKDESTRRQSIVDRLIAEFKNAEQYNSQQLRRDQLIRATKLHEELELMKKKFIELIPLTREHLQAIDDVDQERRDLLIRLDAGKLKIRLQIHRSGIYNMQKGLDPQSLVSESLQTDANGRVVFGNDDFQLEVTSGEVDFEQFQSRLVQLEESFASLLDEFRLTSLEDARKRFADSGQLSRDMKTASANLARELAESTIETLSLELDNSLSKPVRDMAIIQNELAGAQKEVHLLSAEIGQIEKQMAEWTKVYATLDNLQDKLLDSRENRKKQDKLLSELPELPADFEGATTLLAKFEKNDSELRKLKESIIPDIKEHKANLGSGPEMSRLEAEEELKAAESELECQQARLKALIRVEEVFNRLRTELDGGTLDPWLGSLRSILKTLTSENYVDIDTDAGYVSRGESTKMSFDRLSMGTKSCLGIGLRLSMAQHFLKGNDGFVVLDDPMVDLDLARQRAVASVLGEFSNECQVIVVTCHPTHADLLAGNRIELPRLY